MSPNGKPERKTNKGSRPKVKRPREVYNGLCRHCKDRFTCTEPKPLGGVWHCEMYR